MEMGGRNSRKWEERLGVRWRRVPRHRGFGVGGRRFDGFGRERRELDFRCLVALSEH